MKAVSAGEEGLQAVKTAILDIETIADSQAMERARYQPVEGEFAPWPLHALACASVLTVARVGTDDLRFDLQSFTRGGMNERGIVASVERAIESADEVITYNGRGFDIPVLLARAIISDEYVPTLARLFNRARPGLHFDLFERIKSSGAGVKLAHICAPFGIPVKSDAGGARVAAFAADEEWDRIARYCETDAVATWLVAQMWDSAERPGYGRERWGKLGAWIAADQPRLAHLLPYVGTVDAGYGTGAVGPDARSIKL